MLGGKVETVAGPMNDGQREVEHLPFLVQMDPSRPVANPNGSAVVVQKLVNLFFNFVHVDSTGALVEALCANPAVDVLHVRCAHVVSPVLGDEAFAPPSAADAGKSLLRDSISTRRKHIQ